MKVEKICGELYLDCVAQEITALTVAINWDNFREIIRGMVK